MQSAMSCALKIMGQSGGHAVHVAPPVLFILTSCSSDCFDGLAETTSRVRPKCAMLPRMKLEGASGVFHHAPDPPNQRGPADSATQSPGLRPTLLSVAEVPGEVSRQQVTSFLPIAWYVSSLLLRIAGWVPPGQVEGKAGIALPGEQVWPSGMAACQES